MQLEITVNCLGGHYLTVVYFDQLSVAGYTRKQVETLLLSVFNLFCSFQTFCNELNQQAPIASGKNDFFENIKLTKKVDSEVPPQGVDQHLHVDQL